jgi:cysteine synthase
VSSDVFAAEKLKTMAAFGAELTLIESDGGAITPELISRVIDKARVFALEPGTYWTNQLHNGDSLVGYREVGREMLEQLDRSIDWFCASVGTAGLAMGVAEALREGGSEARVAVLEPAASPVISGGDPGSHHVEGWGSVSCRRC